MPLSSSGGAVRSVRSAGLVGDSGAVDAPTGDSSNGLVFSVVDSSFSALPRSVLSSLFSGDSGSGNLEGDAVGGGMSSTTGVSASSASEGSIAGSVFACTTRGRCQTRAEADLKCFLICPTVLALFFGFEGGGGGGRGGK